MTRLNEGWKILSFNKSSWLETALQARSPFLLQRKDTRVCVCVHRWDLGSHLQQRPAVKPLQEVCLSVGPGRDTSLHKKSQRRLKKHKAENKYEARGRCRTWAALISFKWSSWWLTAQTAGRLKTHWHGLKLRLQCWLNSLINQLLVKKDVS